MLPDMKQEGVVELGIDYTNTWTYFNDVQLTTACTSLPTTHYASVIAFLATQNAHVTKPNDHS